MRGVISVGNSQPWRFIIVEDRKIRAAVLQVLREGLDRPVQIFHLSQNFKKANAEALEDYEGERKETYAKLKLAGLKEVTRAAFSDRF